MRATAIEFRLRMAINVAIVVLGFWAPWIDVWGVGRHISLLEWLALALSRTGRFSFALATSVAIVLASLLAAAGVVFRVWGAAYLGPETVISPEMKGDSVIAAAPYRFVRNPLYLGLWFMIAAMSFIMPATGALVTMVLITLFLFRLILGEEAYLSAKLGEPYREYLRAVPRIIPRIRSSLPRSTARPHWAQAALTELTPIGVFFATAFLSWRYDQRLTMRVILITYGVSLVMRALMPGVRRETDLAA